MISRVVEYLAICDYCFDIIFHPDDSEYFSNQSIREDSAKNLIEVIESYGGSFENNKVKCPECNQKRNGNLQTKLIMNSWKDHANLFANGKFELQDLEGEKYTIKGLKRAYFIVDEKTNQSCYVHHCKLIARPISDMSDEEVKTLSNGGSRRMVKNYLRGTCDYHWQSISGRDLLSLLNIGVYPFNQNHNDIIWRYENRKSTTT